MRPAQSSEPVFFSFPSWDGVFTMLNNGKRVCRGCWKKETFNKGGICTACIDSATPPKANPRGVLVGRGPKVVHASDASPVTLAELDDEINGTDSE